MSEVNQIYHVARCGSTLLAFLLSGAASTYAEPGWAKNLLIGLDPLKNIDNYYGTIVKFPSLISCFPKTIPGKKVFLYRPLAQHLCKFKSIDPSWIDLRLEKIDYIINNHMHPKLSQWEPKTKLDKMALIWACSVLRMNDTTDVLYVKTNDLLVNRKETVFTVCDHFNLDKNLIANLDTSIDVKKSSLNGSDADMNSMFSEVIKTNNVKYTYPSYGVIDTELALFDPEINDMTQYVEKNYKELCEFLY